MIQRIKHSCASNENKRSNKTNINFHPGESNASVCSLEFAFFSRWSESNASMCSNGSITHACPTRICVPTKPTLILIPAHRTQASVQMKDRFFIEANLTQICVPTNPTSMRIEGEQGFQQFQHYFSFTRIHSKRSFRLRNMLFCLKRI